MPRSGTLVCCLQNLDFSGANQVVLNIVSGRVHESNVVVLSPTIGSFAAKFVETGVAVRIGAIDDLLILIDDIFCIICNTIMTCHTVGKVTLHCPAFASIALLSQLCWMQHRDLSIHPLRLFSNNAIQCNAISNTIQP